MKRRFFGHQGDEAGPDQGRWHRDPTRTFEERFHDGSTFTPFVRIPGSDRVLWDLRHAGHGPDEEELKHVKGVILQAAGKRIECNNVILRVSWQGADDTWHMRAALPLTRLQQLELVANEDCVGLAVRAAPAKPVRTGPGESLSISLTFPPEHEKWVRELCAFTEWMCGR